MLLVKHATSGQVSGINPNQGLGSKYIEDSLVCSQVCILVTSANDDADDEETSALSDPPALMKMKIFKLVEL